MNRGRSARAFRAPMRVTQRRVFQNGDCYPLCPRCGVTLEREFQAYCDRCGQALSWKAYSRAAVVPGGQKRSGAHAPLPSFRCFSRRSR